MTENKTSKAVETFEDCRIDGLGELRPEDFQAIRQKYLRNEDKLKSLMFFLLSRSQDGMTGDECYDHATQIQDILLFDPLSPSQE